VNEDQADELVAILDRPFPDRPRFHQRSEVFHHYQALCERFHELGATCVVITIAEIGAVGSRKDPKSKTREQHIFDAVQGPDRVKDTTGASDIFIGGYAVELIHQKQAGIRKDMAAAMRMGIKAAGLSVSREGSMPAIPWPEEILRTEFRATSS
jgi:ribokinase